MNNKRKYVIISLLIILCILARFIYLQTGSKIIKANYPLDKIEIDKSTIRIYISDKASLGEVVNLSIFKGVSPKMTNDEIIKILGFPKESSHRYQSKFSVFYTNDGRIEIGTSSGELTSGEVYDNNICMFFKKDFAKGFIFSRNVANFLPDTILDMQIGVFDKNKCDFVINFSTKEEDWIQWESPNL